MNEEKKTPPQYYNSPATTIGFTIMAAVCLFSFIGYKIDEKFKTNFWTLIGIFTGFAFSGYEVWKLVRREQEEEKKNKKIK